MSGLRDVDRHREFQRQVLPQPVKPAIRALRRAGRPCSPTGRFPFDAVIAPSTRCRCPDRARASRAAKWTGEIAGRRAASNPWRSRSSCRSCGPSATAKRARPPRQNGPSDTHAPSCRPNHAVPSLAIERSPSANSWTPRPLVGCGATMMVVVAGGKGAVGAATAGGRGALIATVREASSGSSTSTRTQDSITVVAVRGSLTSRAIAGSRPAIETAIRSSRRCRVTRAGAHAAARRIVVGASGGDATLTQRGANDADQRRIAIETHARAASGGRCVARRTDHRQRDSHAQRDLDRREGAHPHA